jgi:hypothetical protein
VSCDASLTLRSKWRILQLHQPVNSVADSEGLLACPCALSPHADADEDEAVAVAIADAAIVDVAVAAALRMRRSGSL